MDQHPNQLMSPQGTVLGSLLFFLYINDLPNNLTSNVRLFADDCLLYQPIKSDNDIFLLQNDLIKLEEWPKNLAYEIQSHQMLHNDISLKKTDTK